MFSFFALLPTLAVVLFAVYCVNRYTVLLYFLCSVSAQSLVMLQCYVSTDTPFHSVFLLISAQSLVVVHFVFLEQRLHCTEHVIRVVNLVQRPTRVRVGHGIHVDDVKPGFTHGGHCVGTEKGNSLKRQTIKMWHKLIPYRADRPALLDSILSSKPSSQSSESRELELSGTRSKQRKIVRDNETDFELSRATLGDLGT